MTAAAESLSHTDGDFHEMFQQRTGRIERLLHVGSRRVISHLATTKPKRRALLDADEAEGMWLRSPQRPPAVTTGSPLRVIDLFAGCGGLTLGAEEASRALGRPFEPALAVDFDPAATTVYSANFPTAEVRHDDILSLLDGEVGAALTMSERKLARKHNGVDVLLGGPPCQGHSDLNNRTRRRDDKNRLYRSMVRAAEVFQPQNILIENVPAALHDHHSVVQRSADDLSRLGYLVNLAVVDLSRLGVPQRRKRLVLLASRQRDIDIELLHRLHGRNERAVAWAIQDLEGLEASTSRLLVDQVARSKPETRQRIEFLFRHNLHELPNSERPPCHSGGGHSYSSIYGRLHWGQPSQTITTGFYSMCMGRYVHPSKPRTITAHEAARLQYIPDWFDFTSVNGRSSLARMIGNAVPMRLSYAVVLEWLR